MKKNFTVFGIVVLTLVLIAACSRNTAQSTAANSPEKITLNYVSWMTKGEDLPLQNDFMAANPNITVVNQSLDGANYQQLLNTMLLGGSVPDVFLCESRMIPDFVKGGYIQPIGNIQGVRKQAENTTVNDLLSYKGSVYAYAVNGKKGEQFVYYNKLYFEKNGYAVPETLEAFERLMADITAKGGEALAVSAGDTWSANYPAYQLYRNYSINLNFTSPHNAERSLLTGEKKLSDFYGDTFRRLSSYMKNGWVSKNTLSMTWEQATQYLVDGGAQFLVSGNWVPSSTPVQEADPSTFQLGCFPLPIPPLSDGKVHVGAGTDRVIVLSAQSKNPEAARAFFEYFIRDDVLTNYLDQQGLSGMNVVTKSDPVFEYSNALFNSSDYVFEFGLMEMMPPGYDANVWQYSADIYTGASVDELFAKMDADFAAAMSTVNLNEYIDAINALK
jgi:ABC-type glycerol-3-phosphate transport system substrate-binding protein